MSDVKKIATRDSYGNALAELGTAHENVVVLDADLAAATKTGVFKKHIRRDLSTVVSQRVI
jgi:Transketolase, C-terminal subunit